MMDSPSSYAISSFLREVGDLPNIWTFAVLSDSVLAAFFPTAETRRIFVYMEPFSQVVSRRYLSHYNLSNDVISELVTRYSRRVGELQGTVLKPLRRNVSKEFVHSWIQSGKTFVF